MTPAEARAYWRAHEERFSDIDWERDPDGLAGYLGPGQPAWLNERTAALQRKVFDRLMAEVPRHGGDEYALDVGCGAGRWTRVLAQYGYRTVGIDLQEAIIAANRVRSPEIEWHAGPLQSLEDDRRFSVVTAAGVIEMIPYAEQREVIERIAGVLAPKGHVVMLAALDHPSPNAYPHSAEDWVSLFGEAGLDFVAQVPYGWEPLRRAAAAAAAALTSRRLTPELPTSAPPVDPANPGGPVYRAPSVLRVLARADDRLERILDRHRPSRFEARWSAFLFRRR